MQITERKEVNDLTNQLNDLLNGKELQDVLDALTTLIVWWFAGRIVESHTNVDEIMDEFSRELKQAVIKQIELNASRSTNVLQ